MRPPSSLNMANHRYAIVKCPNMTSLHTAFETHRWAIPRRDGVLQQPISALERAQQVWRSCILNVAATMLTRQQRPCRTLLVTEAILCSSSLFGASVLAFSASVSSTPSLACPLLIFSRGVSVVAAGRSAFKALPELPRNYARPWTIRTRYLPLSPSTGLQSAF